MKIRKTTAYFVASLGALALFCAWIAYLNYIVSPEKHTFGV